MNTAQAPARLILSGEHSVVYGQPALAMAIDKFAQTTIASPHGYSSRHSRAARHPRENGDLEDYKLIDSRLRGNDKKGRRNNISFSSLDLNNNESISTDLLEYAFSHICEQLNIKGPLQAGHLCHPREMDSRLRGNDERGLEINSQSNIPIGCGFGSSAAIIISLMHAVINFFALDVTLNQYLTLGREIENLPHGRSSGLDLYLAIHGGCVRFVGQEALSRTMPKIPIQVINTGKPSSNTGECVNFAAKYFRTSNSLATDFGAITEALDKALQDNNIEVSKECIRANHKLLTAIGVVPEKVRNFIAQVESCGAAAKICGAGACTGDNAGAVLLVSETDLTDLVTDYGYEIFPIVGNTCGMQII